MPAISLTPFFSPPENQNFPSLLDMERVGATGGSPVWSENERQMREKDRLRNFSLPTLA